MNKLMITSTIVTAVIYPATACFAVVAGFGTNLIENGGAENAGVSGVIPGWEDGATYGNTTAGSVNKSFVAMNYGSYAQNAQTPSQSVSPYGTSFGSNYFYEFGDAYAAPAPITQTINVSSLATQIDAGATYKAEGFFGGYQYNGSGAELDMTFLSGSGATLGSTLIEQVGWELATLAYTSTTGTLPVGTRSIVFTVQGHSIPDDASRDGSADNLSFVLTPTPEPASLSLLAFAAIPMLGRRSRRA